MGQSFSGDKDRETVSKQGGREGEREDGKEEERKRDIGS